MIKFSRLSPRAAAIVAAVGLAAAAEATGPKGRRDSLPSLVCQSDIIVVGALHVYLGSAVGITSTATDVNNNRFLRGPDFYDLGQITTYSAEKIGILKDDPWRDTVGVVNVVLRSTRAATMEDFQEAPIIRDKERWLWLLHREHILGRQYFVLRQLSLSDEPAISKLLQEKKCGEVQK